MPVKQQPPEDTGATGSTRKTLTSAPGGNVSSGYSKPMEFHADGPGRVIVRLERLMDSDRIRITDPKYMSTLLSRLGEEEEKTWRRRTRERRRAEHNRYRQLVIDGYTEPTSKMQDLCNHPMFRINRIVQRLSKRNYRVRDVKLPPIVPVDPFEHDDSGAVFKKYPGHYSQETWSGTGRELANSSNSALMPQTNTPVKSIWGQKYYEYRGESAETDELTNDGEFGGRLTAGSENPPSAVEESLIKPSHISVGASKLVQKAKEREGRTVLANLSAEKYEPTKRTIQEIQKLYGVAPQTNLGSKWRPYQSPLVNPLFTDKRLDLVRRLYQLGNDIKDMYARQLETVSDYVAALEPIVESPESRAAARAAQGDDEDDLKTIEDDSEHDSEYLQKWLNGERRHSWNV